VALAVRVADAFVAAAILVTLECVIVALFQRRQFAHGFEIAAVLAGLLPLALVAVAPLSIGGAMVAIGLDRPHTRRRRVVVAFAAALLAFAVAWGVSAGRQLHGARRPVFVAVVVVSAVAAAYFGSRPAAHALAAVRRRGHLWLASTVVAVALLLELLNLFILPRLYPAFHAGLAALCIWLVAPLGGVWNRWSVSTRLLLAAVLLLSAGGLALGAPHRLAYHDNVRLIYLDHAPLMGHAVRLSGWLEAPPPLDAPLVAPAQPEQSLDFSGHDVLLVSIDALRADHVGAYGYERDTTPALDALAREGALFEAAYTAAPHTSYAVSSLMTGKYMRPLLRQGVGQNSATWAQIFRRYGHLSAGFYPPAVFFVDRERFASFERSALGFEYKKVQFASATERIAEVRAYLSDLEPAQRRTPLFLWVHLFEPHEPYEAHPAYDFGDRAIDRYDAEVRAADEALGQIVAEVRRVRPRLVTIVTADHGEEFGDHGGRYHGTTVYDEQVRVPLVIHAPGVVPTRRVMDPVSLVDLLPTVLSAKQIPISPRVRGRDLGPLLTRGRDDVRRYAFSESEQQTLLAEGRLRLICERAVGACRLFDVRNDPGEQNDVSVSYPQERMEMHQRLRQLSASMGRFERGGAAGASRWPQALRRGLAGDADAAVEVAGLLDDADVEIRRKAAEVLFDLAQADVSPQLMRALSSDEDDTVRRWCALALTRTGHGAPRTIDLLTAEAPAWRRLAALALAEAGDARGEAILIAWWRAAYPEDPGDDTEPLAFERAKQIVAALANIESARAVGPLTWGLRDVRLRVVIAEALAEIGHNSARPGLAAAFAEERYLDARIAMAHALVKLGASGELREPLIRFMGSPDPLPGALGSALEADILAWVGGPRERELEHLQRYATSGVAIGIVIPEGDADTGLRVFVRARTSDGAEGQLRVAYSPRALPMRTRSEPVPGEVPRLDPELTTRFVIPATEDPSELHQLLPAKASAQIQPGEQASFAVYGTQNVILEAIAVIPLVAAGRPLSP